MAPGIMATERWFSAIAALGPLTRIGRLRFSRRPVVTLTGIGGLVLFWPVAAERQMDVATVSFGRRSPTPDPLPKALQKRDLFHRFAPHGAKSERCTSWPHLPRRRDRQRSDYARRHLPPSCDSGSLQLLSSSSDPRSKRHLEARSGSPWPDR